MPRGRPASNPISYHIRSGTILRGAENGSISRSLIPEDRSNYPIYADWFSKENKVGRADLPFNLAKGTVVPALNPYSRISKKGHRPVTRQIHIFLVVANNQWKFFDEVLTIIIVIQMTRST